MAERQSPISAVYSAGLGDNYVTDPAVLTVLCYPCSAAVDGNEVQAGFQRAVGRRQALPQLLFALALIGREMVRVHQLAKSHAMTGPKSYSIYQLREERVVIVDEKKQGGGGQYHLWNLISICCVSHIWTVTQGLCHLPTLGD